ncbi:MAG: hypothetical protein K0U38_06640, partial [Epsilonproteobacteria bacterium]|nr:hypothetical protein [Campylobacterota bacterium]
MHSMGWGINPQMRVVFYCFIDEVVVAIPISEENDILAKYVIELGVKVYRGSESNVLSRFYEA